MTLNSRPLLLSFSGIDGAGKSTQIQKLHDRLAERGLKVARLAFWDDVVVFPGFRSSITHRVLGGEQGIGEPGKPVKRNDKNARRWSITLARSPFYLFDVLSLRRTVRRAKLTNVDVIIFDRYIYDQIAHIPDNLIGRHARKILLRLAPKPDIAFLIDADPEVATARKPEYPLDFVYRYRNDYFGLCALASEIVVIEGGTIDAVQHRIWRHIEMRLRTQLHSVPETRSASLSAQLPGPSETFFAEEFKPSDLTQR